MNRRAALWVAAAATAFVLVVTGGLASRWLAPADDPAPAPARPAPAPAASASDREQAWQAQLGEANRLLASQQGEIRQLRLAAQSVGAAPPSGDDAREHHRGERHDEDGDDDDGD